MARVQSLESYARQTNNARRRAARLAAARERGTHTALEWQVLKAIFADRCVKCGHLGSEKDHIVPLHQDGSDAIENLQPLCALCNVRKGTEAIDYREVVYPRWREHFVLVLKAVEKRLL